MIIDLNAAGLTSLDGTTLNYCRFDFIGSDHAEDDYFDIQFVGFFNSAEYAKAYNGAEEVHTHSHQEVVTAPTCTEAGYTTFTCECGDTYTGNETAALGHDIVVDAAVEATCTATGLTAGEHCSRCNHKVNQEIVDALGHTEVVDAAVEATCTTAGKTEGKHCSACGEILTAQETIDALGHSYVNGICGACGAEDPDYVVIPVTPEEAGVKATSFDTFYVNGSMYFEVDGDAGGRLTLIDNTIRFAEGEPHESMALRGWVGFEKPIVSFGYFIDNSNMIYGDFKQATEGGVLAVGGAHASRFQIDVPLADLEAGDHSVGFVAKLEDGTVVRLRANLTVIIPEKPIVEDPVGPDVERYEDLVVDMSTLGGSGYMAEYPAAGYTSPIQILGYYVTINLGQVDLSKYSAVKITYGCDGSPNTEAEFAASSSLAIGLKSEDSSYGQETTDNFSGDIAHTQMVFSSISWAGGAREAIVDLSNIDYNGNVWIAVHNPGGTQIVVSAIEFVGAEKVNKPINPADPVVLVTPEDLLARCNEGSVYSASQVASAEVMTEGDRTFIRLTASGIDPYISLITANSATPVPYYMAIAYRTNSSSRGQFYIGSTGLWSGSGDKFKVTWSQGDWNYMIIDLNAAGLTSLDGTTLNYCRFDFVGSDHAEDDYFDIQFVGFFNSAEYAEAYNITQ